MSREDIRLECLKLVHRHDQTIEMVVKRAQILEAYVSGAGGEELQEKPIKRSRKVADNSSASS